MSAFDAVFTSGLSLTLSTLIEGKTFNQGGHKIGVGLDFEA